MLLNIKGRLKVVVFYINIEDGVNEFYFFWCNYKIYIMKFCFGFFFIKLDFNFLNLIFNFW